MQQSYGVREDLTQREGLTEIKKGTLLSCPLHCLQIKYEKLDDVSFCDGCKHRPESDLFPLSVNGRNLYVCKVIEIFM